MKTVTYDPKQWRLVPVEASHWVSMATVMHRMEFNQDDWDLLLSAAPEHPSQPVSSEPVPPLQAGMDNSELLAAWQKKLPDTEPKGQELSAFALGVEFGFERTGALKAKLDAHQHGAALPGVRTATH